MLIAIYGHSCTGKTTLAAELGQRYGIPVRHCGREVADAAHCAGVEIGALSAEAHVQIDRETLDWAAARLDATAIVEGRFLDYVLGSIRSRLLLVKCDADMDFRLACMKRRLARDVDVTHLRAVDDADRAFCDLLYAVPAKGPDLVLLTSNCSLDSCVAEVICAAKKSS